MYLHAVYQYVSELEKKGMTKCTCRCIFEAIECSNSRAHSGVAVSPTSFTDEEVDTQGGRVKIPHSESDLFHFASWFGVRHFSNV